MAIAQGIASNWILTYSFDPVNIRSLNFYNSQ